MYSYKYPHPAVTTDCVVFAFDGEKLHVLLIKRGFEPYRGSWAFPGGFLTPDEDADQCALRELHEETQLVPGFIEQFHTYSAPGRDPRERVISIAYIAIVKLSEVTAGDDAADVRWFPIDSLPPLAFDHDVIIKDAIARLKEKIALGQVEADLLPKESMI